MDTDCIRLGTAGSDTMGLSDKEYLQRISWKNAADLSLASAAATGNVLQFTRLLQRALKGRTRVKRVQAVADPLLFPLWSRYAVTEADNSGSADFLLKLNRLLQSGKSRSRISEFIDNQLHHESAPWTPLVYLQWLTVLEEAGAELEASTLVRLWRAVLEQACILSPNSDFGASSPDESRNVDDARLLAAGELPWRVGLCFGVVKGAGEFRRFGRAKLNEALGLLTDEDGMPHARCLARLPLLLAGLTRSSYAGMVAGRKLWKKNAARRFRGLVKRSAALSQADGNIALSNGASFATSSLLRTAMVVADIPPTKPVAQSLLGLPADSLVESRRLQKTSRLLRRKHVRLRFDSRHSPAAQSDWAEWACLRNNWQQGADRCIIAYDQAQPRISLTVFDRPLTNGRWGLEGLSDGTRIAVDAPWTCVCWFSDKDVDYMELQLTAPTATFYRHVLLSRTDHWLFAADALCVPEARPIELVSRWPVVSGVEAITDRTTRELSLVEGKLRVRICPLGLDQQRVVHAWGSLEHADGEMTLRQRATGTAIYSPLFIDWSPERKSDAVQWRQLTVAENGAAVARDVAVGYRLRVGKHHWLFYRSFKPGETARSVLGHHTQYETVIGEFTSNGEVEPLVMVE